MRADKKVLLLNGPAGSGKDTIARILMTMGYEQAEFKNALFQIALSVSGVCPMKWIDRYENRNTKEQPWKILGGISQREFLIKISEEWVKPLLGEEHFGHLAVKEVLELFSKYDRDVVFSDSGFQSEMEPLIEQFGIDNVVLVRLNRDGYDFSGDSRSYLEPVEGQPFISVDLIDGDPEAAVYEIFTFVERLKEEETW